MKEIRSEIRINTSVSKVWEVLTDFRAFPVWNLFMVYLKGKPAHLTAYVKKIFR